MDMASLVFDIAVLGIPALSFGTQEIDDRRYTVNVPITAFALPEVEGGNGLITYKLERTLAFGVGTSLPLGLRFDPDTRVLAGTPTRTQGAIEYTYTATDSVGKSATLTFEIMVVAGTSLRFGTQPTRPPSRQTAEPVDLAPYFGVREIDDQVLYAEQDYRSTHFATRWQRQRCTGLQHRRNTARRTSIRRRIATIDWDTDPRSRSETLHLHRHRHRR